MPDEPRLSHWYDGEVKAPPTAASTRARAGARDTLPQTAHLRSGEEIVHGRRLTLTRDQYGLTIDGAVVGSLRSPGGAHQLFVHHRNVDANAAGLFRRWADHAPAHGIAR
ncbi:hypothetical protein [Streptomyces atratus]|uniref:hypothetical protein n=1 Tax=Streptomyces atratus TaxID=1893 RepID=UPI0033CD9549